VSLGASPNALAVRCNQAHNTTKGDIMNMTIYLFLLAGAGFGIITFPFKHLFSEGPHKADEKKNQTSLDGRFFWVMVCTFLWPIMALTGLNSARILIKRRTKNTLGS
jgi:hypothetical protein